MEANLDCWVRNLRLAHQYPYSQQAYADLKATATVLACKLPQPPTLPNAAADLFNRAAWQLRTRRRVDHLRLDAGHEFDLDRLCRGSHSYARETSKQRQLIRSVPAAGRQIRCPARQQIGEFIRSGRTCQLSRGPPPFACSMTSAWLSDFETAGGAARPRPTPDAGV